MFLHICYSIFWELIPKIRIIEKICNFFDTTKYRLHGSWTFEHSAQRQVRGFMLA